jgi:hypothetical protein
VLFCTISATLHRLRRKENGDWKKEEEEEEKVEA